MGHSRRQPPRPRARIPNTRARTRGSAKLIDPEANTAMLNALLSSLGLYAANILGDGNCLFRALSDQLYGTPANHLELRHQICEWMGDPSRRAWYEPFVEDDRGLDEHLRCMRQPGTYGGHLELSAFAHLKRRDVKVVQPGLIYVIEWGGDLSPVKKTDVSAPSTSSTSTSSAEQPSSTPLSARDQRRSRRVKKHDSNSFSESTNQHADADGDEDAEQGAIYVAYHDWEHFSSVRNLTGPHTGLPKVVERLESATDQPPPPPPPLPSKSKAKPKAAKPPKKGKAASAAPSVIEPASIPLPPSRSPSPTPLLSDRRSPKRTFEESNEGTDGSESGRRTKAKRSPVVDDKMDVDSSVGSYVSENTELSEETSESSVHEEPPALARIKIPPKSKVPPPTPAEKPLTRRQRKALGLPKPRPAASTPARTTRSAGSIVIPGGRFVGRPRGSTANSMKKPDEDDDDADGEWAKNGTGRVDVRGFRELRI